MAAAKMPSDTSQLVVCTVCCSGVSVSMTTMLLLLLLALYAARRVACGLLLAMPFVPGGAGRGELELLEGAEYAGSFDRELRHGPAVQHCLGMCDPSLDMMIL